MTKRNKIIAAVVIAVGALVLGTFAFTRSDLYQGALLGEISEYKNRPEFSKLVQPVKPDRVVKQTKDNSTDEEEYDDVSPVTLGACAHQWSPVISGQVDYENVDNNSVWSLDLVTTQRAALEDLDAMVLNGCEFRVAYTFARGGGGGSNAYNCDSVGVGFVEGGVITCTSDIENVHFPRLNFDLNRGEGNAQISGSTLGEVYGIGEITLFAKK